ncbi:murein biosynthesis integral membrane protein MurJ [Microbacteriaceae bacterium VKM Ac-2854]|nr:murein biosynthesis integral membrane protein MurJ [Microbacteriaceae bacterium VKM Ac-2854]
MVSRVLGFALTIVSANVIGQTSEGANTFGIANLLPNTIYGVIAGGALNAVLVPQIVRSFEHADGGEKYINRLITLALSILLGATVLATGLAPFLVLIFGAALPNDAQFDLAVAFAFWCLPQVFFYGLYTILGEVLNARGSFGPFTWAPAVNNVVAISGVLVFGALFGIDTLRVAAEWTPDMVAVLAGTATLGVALQAIILIFFWKRVGLRYRPDFRVRGVGLGAAGRLAGWSFAAFLLTVVAGAVESNVTGSASDSLSENVSTKALQNSWLLFMLPHSIIAVSIATAYFTKMSGHAARGEMKAFAGDVSASIRVVAMLLVLAAAGLCVVAVPFATLFGGGFEVSRDMGAVIAAYAVALPLFSTLAIVQRAAYALGDGRTPFLYTLVQVIIVIIGCLLAFQLPDDQRAWGVAVSTSVSIVIQSLLGCILLRLRLGGGGRRVAIRFLQYIAAVIPATVVGFVVLWLLGGTVEGGFAVEPPFGSIVSMAAIAAPMVLVYFGVLWIMRVPELRSFAAPVLRRLGR